MVEVALTLTSVGIITAGLRGLINHGGLPLRRALLAILFALSVVIGTVPHDASAQNWTSPTCTDGARTGGFTTYCAGAEFSIGTVNPNNTLAYYNGTPWYQGQSECAVNPPGSGNSCTWGVYNFSEWFSPDNGANWYHEYAWGTNDTQYGNGGGYGLCCSSWTQFYGDGYTYYIQNGGIVGYTTSQELHDYWYGGIYDSCGTILWIETWNNSVFDSGAPGC